MAAYFRGERGKIKRQVYETDSALSWLKARVNYERWTTRQNAGADMGVCLRDPHISCHKIRVLTVEKMGMNGAQWSTCVTLAILHLPCQLTFQETAPRPRVAVELFVRQSTDRVCHSCTTPRGEIGLPCGPLTSWAQFSS